VHYHLEGAAGQQPESVPAPAAQPLPDSPQTTMPEIPGEPDSRQPSEPPLAPPFDDDSPLEPPRGDTLPPPLEEAPFAPRQNDTLPPFDAPPAMPPESDVRPVQPNQPPSPSDTKPSEELPEPNPQDPTPNLDSPPPMPGSDTPPSMPDEDPFKDDPEAPLGPPSGPAPKSNESTDAPPTGLEPAAARWRVPGGAGMEVELPAQAEAPAAGNEPRRLRVDASGAGTALLPACPVRANPLRPASHASRPDSIVPTASYSATSPAAAGGESGAWRRNPLRSN
jgi:hypothetical protein